MEKNYTETIGKIRSVMERGEGNMTPREAQINEQMRIDEATAKNRVQVTRDEILDILDKADETQNQTNQGLFATITYVKPESLLKTKRNIDNDRLHRKTAPSIVNQFVIFYSIGQLSINWRRKIPTCHCSNTIHQKRFKCKQQWGHLHFLLIMTIFM